MIHPIVDEKSHAKALERIRALWNASPGSLEERELDALATLVDTYERRAFPILPPEPIAAIVARCQDLSWSRRDLEPLIGSRARVSEILSGRRQLTLSMIRKIHSAMGIPADLLIREPPKRSRKPAAPSVTKRVARRRSHQRSA